MRNKDYKEEIKHQYETFWKDLVEVNGKMEPGLVKNELYDYGVLLDSVNKVYHELTGGNISKANTCPDAVISEANRVYDEIAQEYAKECMEPLEVEIDVLKKVLEVLKSSHSISDVLDATKESIEKWKNIYNGKELLGSHYVESCSLCDLFYSAGCDGCPLQVIEADCGDEESPWMYFEDVYRRICPIPSVEATMNDVSGNDRQLLRFFSLLMIKKLEECQRLLENAYT